MECKAMTMPMASNLKLLSDVSLGMVDAMMYDHMICSLMHIMNTRLDICFVVNTLSQFLTEKRNSLKLQEGDLIPSLNEGIW